MRTWILAGLLMACSAPEGTPVESILGDLNFHYGKTITVRTKLASGARCRVGDEEGEWKTYCKDCQYCRGPLVVSPDGERSENELDWPMILGGTWEYQDIRCKGPLDEIVCYPFVPGRTYVIRGVLERHQPPRLLVNKWWAVD